VGREYAAIISAAYISAYAIGRLLAGVIAQSVGSVRAYDIIMGGMFVSLMLLPVTLRGMSHESQESPGCTLFSLLSCVIGLLYGGGQALYYSLVFDVYGAVNYKPAFALLGVGFANAVVVGGLSSAYSFSGRKEGLAARELAETWFYVMAGCTLAGWLLVRLLRPFDYKAAARRFRKTEEPTTINYKPDEIKL